MAKIDITASLSLDDLAAQLVSASNHDALLKFIQTIDAKVAEWGFTMKLHRHFAAQKKVYDAEVAADQCTGPEFVEGEETP